MVHHCGYVPKILPKSTTSTSFNEWKETTSKRSPRLRQSDLWQILSFCGMSVVHRGRYLPQTLQKLPGQQCPRKLGLKNHQRCMVNLQQEGTCQFYFNPENHGCLPQSQANMERCPGKRKPFLLWRRHIKLRQY